jgi:hypothetical protein
LMKGKSPHALPILPVYIDDCSLRKLDTIA